MSHQTTLALLLLISVGRPSGAPAADEPAVSRVEDVVYGRKFGTALTLDVFRPEPKSRANGVGLIFVVSGG